VKIIEYQNADSLNVLHLNRLSLGYPLTSELAARILRSDPRAFPFLGVYAVDDGVVAGQVLVYRLPVITWEGPEDVGGVAAVCTYPVFSHRGVASQLFDEAHQRMRAAGPRFSTLATARHRLAYLLYQRLGYVDLFSFASACAPVQSVRTESELRAECATPERLAAADALFRRLSAGRLGFARRHDP
jgi:GNAT superfamily N-acetyltransferase